MEQSNLFCQCLLTISLVACVTVEAHPCSETAMALAATLTFNERAMLWGTVKMEECSESFCSYFPVYKCDISMENIPSHSFCLPFLPRIPQIHW